MDWHVSYPCLVLTRSDYIRIYVYKVQVSVINFKIRKTRFVFWIDDNCYLLTDFQTLHSIFGTLAYHCHADRQLCVEISINLPNFN